MEGVTEIIIESTKMSVETREEGDKGGRIEGGKVGMAVEDTGGHSADASALLKSSSFLHKPGSSRPSDLLRFFFLLLLLLLFPHSFLWIF